MSIDGRPKVVDIAWYAGDTLRIAVTAPASLVDGKEWSAQIRSTREAATVDEVFAITPPAPGSGGPAYLELTAAQTRALAEGGVVQSVRADSLPKMLRSRATSAFAVVQRYAGEWDVQVSGVAGVDPVTTLAQGALTIDQDVTRTP